MARMIALPSELQIVELRIGICLIQNRSQSMFSGCF